MNLLEKKRLQLESIKNERWQEYDSILTMISDKLKIAVNAFNKRKYLYFSVPTINTCKYFNLQECKTFLQNSLEKQGFVVKYNKEKDSSMTIIWDDDIIQLEKENKKLQKINEGINDSEIWRLEKFDKNKIRIKLDLSNNLHKLIYNNWLLRKK